MHLSQASLLLRDGKLYFMYPKFSPFGTSKGWYRHFLTGGFLLAAESIGLRDREN